MSERSAETEALRGIPFFAGVTDQDLANMVTIGQKVSFTAGQPIVEKGDPGDGMYIVLDGKAQVDVGGRYHNLTSGSFFGEMALIGRRKRMATVTAVEPVTALRIPADDFRTFLLGNPSVSVAILEALVDRLREVQDRIDAWIGS